MQRVKCTITGGTIDITYDINTIAGENIDVYVTVRNIDNPQRDGFYVTSITTPGLTSFNIRMIFTGGPEVYVVTSDKIPFFQITNNPTTVLQAAAKGIANVDVFYTTRCSNFENVLSFDIKFNSNSVAATSINGIIFQISVTQEYKKDIYIGASGTVTMHNL